MSLQLQIDDYFDSTSIKQLWWKIALPCFHYVSHLTSINDSKTFQLNIFKRSTISPFLVVQMGGGVLIQISRLV